MSKFETAPIKPRKPLEPFKDTEYTDDWYKAAMAHQEAIESHNHYYVLELSIMRQDGSTYRDHTTFMHVMELDFGTLGSDALHHHIYSLFTKYKKEHQLLMQVNVEKEFWR